MVHALGGHWLERRGALVVVATLAAPLWLASCTGDDDDGTGNDAGAGTTTAGADTGGEAGAMNVAGTTATAGRASSSGGRSTAGASSAAGGAGGSGAGTAGSSGAGTGAAAGATSGGGAGVGAGGGSGSPGNGGSSSGATGGSSTGGTGGTEPDAGRGGSGGDAGTGGGSSIGGRGPMPGFACGDLTCTAGQTCVTCSVGVTPTYESRCAPNQDDDPDGYAEAIKGCQQIYGISHCDGPEDCPTGEHCVYTSTSHGKPICQADPEVGPTANCCFSCDGLPVCTLCWTDYDCPETFICVRSAGQPQDGPGGCRLAE